VSRGGAGRRRRSSTGQNCVEVATHLPGLIAIRDSKNPYGPNLIFTPGEWAAFTQKVKDGNLC
jgi:Domain of unknown function (DUF397)